MGHPDKKSILRTRDDDILLEYAHAYYASNGFPAHLRLLKSGRYAIDGTHIHKGKPIIVSAIGYNISELPGMAKNLLSNAINQRQVKLIGLIQRLMPIPVHEVIANEFQTSERG